MSTEDERFLQRLLATFRIEAEEHLKAMSKLLFELEKPASETDPPHLVETLFREAHSLKGAARAVNLGEIEMICQTLESVLALLKRNELPLSPEFFSALNRAVDLLNRTLLTGGDEKPADNASEMRAVIAALEQLLLRRPVAPVAVDHAPAAETAVPKPPAKRAPSVASNADATVRISTVKLGALLVQAEELLAFKFSSAHLVGELRSLNRELAQWKKTWGKTVRDARMVRRAAERHGNGARGDKKPVLIDRLLDAVERDEFFAKSFGDRLIQLERMAEQERRALAGMVDNLLDDMKQALMLPFSSMFEMLPKMVRDLGRDSGKEVELVFENAALEIDRRILEQMKDPLIHLVRNAIDHGIEAPAERSGKHKPARGRITIEITPKDGSKVELVVADDGRGIDVAKVRSAAQKLDLLLPETSAALNEHDALAMVFESGLSTSPILTDMSGRGLGLAIVREKVEKLGGSVTVELPEQGGSCFRIILPTTLATFRGLLVGLGGRQFVLPSRNVERVARVALSLVKTVENRETIELGRQAMSLVYLSDVLGLSRSAGAKLDYLPVAVLTSGGKRIAFVVDEVLGDQEVLLKGLGPQLPRVPNVAGATVLGAGRVVPILNVADLLKSAGKAGAVRHAVTEQPSISRPSLLIAEDSITSRSLLKNILESAGYDVVATVDGLDAFTTLRSGRFDLVVSDVEMPRMDGFDLTARIRADKNLAELPVILVTALDSREHKERGIDVGANAYIVKSSFDQGNLLEVIRRLL